MCCCFDALHVSWEGLDEKYFHLSEFWFVLLFSPCDVLFAILVFQMLCTKWITGHYRKWLGSFTVGS